MKTAVPQRPYEVINSKLPVKMANLSNASNTFLVLQLKPVAAVCCYTCLAFSFISTVSV